MRVWAAFALLLAACRGGAATPDEAIAAGNALISESLPQVHLYHFRIEARDQGSRWRVAYIPPEDSTGGPMVIYVDKRTGAASLPPVDPNANVYGAMPPPP